MIFSSEVRGDLLRSTNPVIVHGCNAAGKFGAGIAKQIRYKWPSAYDDYMFAFHGGLSLGEVVWSDVGNRQYVVHAITQKDVRSAHNPSPVSLDAIHDAFCNIGEECKERGIENISIPMIGAGLGGGNWDEIRDVIVSVPYDTKIDLHLGMCR